MGNFKKGDLVRLENALKVVEGDSYLHPVHSGAGNPGEVNTVSGVNPEGNIFLEGYGDTAYCSDLFERVCSVCQNKKVLFQIRSLDKCYDCTKNHREETLERLKSALSLEQLLLLKEYLKAEGDFNSINLMH